MTNFMFPSLKEFREWLELKGSEYVGKTRTSCNCPYHNFLQERGLIQSPDPRNGYHPTVWNDMIILGPNPGEFVYSPNNVRSFIRKLDNYYADCTMVTGKFCVGLLDSLGLEE